MSPFRKRLRFAAIAVSVSLFVQSLGSMAETPAENKPPKFSAAETAFYERDVLPILQAKCYKCHGNGKTKGDLSLESREAILKGGDLGPAVSLDKPDKSLLLQAINHGDDLKMPPSGKLPQKEIDVLAKWVKAGLPMPAAKGVAKTESKGRVITAEDRSYWAYKPIHRFAAPQVKNKSWVRNPIDAFILAKLEEKGLSPAGPADRLALIRRVYFDLIGLPPTPEEVDAFVNDKSPDAYEKLIDKLLSSPHYGEKWGRHWLDLVRYAETNGYERDGIKPHAWRYRDYVIKSFNQDKPYDQFIKEQLAGDEIDRNNPDCIIATGYYRLGIWQDEPVDPVQTRYDDLDDIVATTAQVMLGMTINCCRCHDHKIDPIPQRDYYSMLAFFQDVPPFSDTRETSSKFNLTDITPPAKRAMYEAELKQRQSQIEELTRKMEVIENEAIKKMPAEDQRASEGPDRPKVVEKVPRFLEQKRRGEYLKLRTQRDDLKKKPTPSQELALSVNNCSVPPPETNVLIRGNAHARGAKVEPAFPEVLGHKPPSVPAPPKDARTSGRRTRLAEWMASKENQLTARVMANRLWQHHFGRGIVPTSNDFGKFGTLPSHPELLDWLASEFMDGGWRIKRMHKLIMLSNAYQMSAAANSQALRVDPANMLLWRSNMRRLTAEELRDSMLAVSGRLNLKMGGPSVYPPMPKAVHAGQSMPGEGWPTSPPAEASRRSVYVHIKRALLVPILIAHDQADTDSSCPVRYTTIVPTQALGMLNGDFANEQAAAFAERLAKESPAGLAGQIRRAIRLTTGRNPAEEEVKKDAAFVHDLRNKSKMNEADALRQFCLMMLNTNEFVYLD